jgi:hypothetical protein
MTKTGSSTNTSPDVAVVSPTANVNANAYTTTPTRPRLGSRDISTGSLHRRQSGGSFEFHTTGVDAAAAAAAGPPLGGLALTVTPTALARTISSGSGNGNGTTPDFPTTIEYRAASSSSSYNSSLPVMLSPNWVRGISWSSCWTEEDPDPERLLDHHQNKNKNFSDYCHDIMDEDDESLWISEDEDEEHGNVNVVVNANANVDANTTSAVISVSETHPPVTGEMERKHSLGYISPAEGDSSSSSSSSSSSPAKGGQEMEQKKQEQQQQQPEHQLQQVAPPNDWMLQWAQQGTTTTTASPGTTPFTIPVESPAMVIDEDIPTQEADIPPVDAGPVYLPVPDQHRRTEDESAANNNKVILSGWVAVSADDSLLVKLAASDARPALIRSDLALLELTRDSLILRRGTNQAVTVVPLSNDCQVSAREISSRAGKCVVISKSSNTVCTILPVSLPQQFFAATEQDELELVGTDRFDRLRSCMFTPFVVEETATATPLLLSKPAAATSRTATCDLMWGQEYCVRHYAPNEQHDMARHLQFAIDSAIRMS